MPSILDNLNSAQRDAVLHHEGPLLIFAGAGSGKTRVLTHRIAHLIADHGVSPWNILAVTFTNKAANEMKERIEKLVGSSVAREMWVGTFHAICSKILRIDGNKNGLDRNFVVYDGSDQTAVIKRCLKDLGLSDNKNIQPSAVLHLISRAKEKLVIPEQFSHHFGGSPMEDIAGSVYRLYQEELFSSNALDFDDLIMQTVLLLRAQPAVLEKYQEKFRHILVDEYQDINKAQYELIKCLAAKHRNLCCVGDDDQSIYRFRGANVGLILAFDRDYPETTVVKLEQNYRSTGNILDAAHAVVAKNETRRDKKLWTEQAAGEKLRLFAANSEREEAMWVAERMQDGRAAKGREWRDFAVLYRTNAQSRQFEDVFLSYRIPYRIVGGQRFYERKEVKDIVSYLRLALNPAEAVSLRRVSNVPPRGIGQTSFGRVEEFATRNGITLFEACERVDEIQGVIPKARAGVAAFVEIVRRLSREMETLSVRDLTAKAMEISGYLDMLRAEKTTEAETRIENLQELLTATQEFEQYSEDKSLRAFLEGVSLMSDLDAAPEDENAVVLMTLHSAKGLEFPVVFMVGMEEGIFPHSRSAEDKDELEEERRLAYVGITRAREELYLTHALSRLVYGMQQMNRVSRFVNDIPSEVLDDRRASHAVPPPWANQPRTTPSLWEQMQKRNVTGPARRTATPDNATPFKVGQKVRHAKFGTGVIVTAQGAGDDAQVSVAFPDAGVKKLLLAYAKLEKI